MKRMILGVAMLAAAIIAAPALAQTTDPHAGHTGHGASEMPMGDMLTASIPANNAVLTQSPRALSLTFMHPVMLQTVSVSGPGDAPVQATFRRPQAPTLSYSIALPTLSVGAYHVRWTASGGGHEMSGELHFTVQ